MNDNPSFIRNIYSSLLKLVKYKIIDILYLMNVVLPINHYSNNHIHLLDSKQNIITDGIFTKIIFSNQLFAMNGLFIFFPIDTENIINSNGRYFINFNPNSTHNTDIINQVFSIEEQILNLYKNTNQVNSVNELYGETPYLHIYDTAQTVNLGDKLKVCFIPWLCAENEFDSYIHMDKTDAKIAMGHLELTGFLMFKGFNNISRFRKKDTFNHHSSA